MPSARQLSASVFLYEPQASTAPQKAIQADSPPFQALNIPGKQQPKLVILATWMGAGSPHVAKYVSGYQQLFPAARVLVIRSSPLDWLFWPDYIQRRWLTPAISTILSSCNPAHLDLIISVFSNGGSRQACQLLRSYQEHTSSPLTGYTTVFDSCPGRAHFASTILAFKLTPLPSFPILRMIAIAMIYVSVSTYWMIARLIGYLSGVLDPIEQIRASLMDRSLMGGEKARCYVYSDTDRLVSSVDVEAHAIAAVAKGFTVRQERFTDTGHCAHIRGEGAQRYWAMVADLWQTASSKGLVFPTREYQAPASGPRHSHDSNTLK